MAYTYVNYSDYILTIPKFRERGCPLVHLLTVSNTTSQGRLPAGFDCGGALSLARRRLRSFDVVGLTECTLSYWLALLRRLGWTHLTHPQVLRAAEFDATHFKPGPIDPAVRKWSDRSLAEPLGAPARTALMHGTRFDAYIYAEGARLAGAAVEDFDPAQHAREVARGTGAPGYPRPQCPATPRLQVQQRDPRQHEPRKKGSASATRQSHTS